MRFIYAKERRRLFSAILRSSELKESQHRSTADSAADRREINQPSIDY